MRVCDGVCVVVYGEERWARWVPGELRLKGEAPRAHSAAHACAIVCCIVRLWGGRVAL